MQMIFEDEVERLAYYTRLVDAIEIIITSVPAVKESMSLLSNAVGNYVYNLVNIHSPDESMTKEGYDILTKEFGLALSLYYTDRVEHQKTSSTKRTPISWQEGNVINFPTTHFNPTN